VVSAGGLYDLRRGVGVVTPNGPVIYIYI